MRGVGQQYLRSTDQLPEGDENLYFSEALAIAALTGENISIFVNDAGYLTSFTESDPVFGAHAASDITAGDITNLSNLSGTNTGDQDLSGLVPKSLYDAHTILQATSDNTPVALTVAEQRIVGRITAGNITALTASEVRTLINVADGATADAKATGTELDTGTDDAKFATAKAIKDAHNVPSVAPGTSGNLMRSNGTDWTSFTPSYLTSESDPVFGASAAASITGTDLSNWDAAFAWGNHASAGYLTSVDISSNTNLAATSPIVLTGDTLSHADTAVTPGTYTSVTVDQKGHVTGGTNPAPTAITVANEASDTSCFPLFVTAATGDLGPKTNAGLTYNSSTGLLASTLLQSLGNLVIGSGAAGVDYTLTFNGETSDGVLTWKEDEGWLEVPMLTSPHTGSNSERFGNTSEASSDNCTAFGNNAAAYGANATAIGQHAWADNTTGGTAGSVALGYNTFTDAGVAIGFEAESPSGGTAIGTAASASGGFTVAIGTSSDSAGASTVCIGANSTAASGTSGIAIGNATSIGSGSARVVLIGVSAASSGGADDVICIGTAATSAFSDVICLGSGAAATAAGQCLIGGQTGATDVCPITAVYVGRGVAQSSTDATVSINATGGSGTSVSGSALVLRGGLGTGNTTGGYLAIETGPGTAGSSTTQQTAVERVRFKAGTEAVFNDSGADYDLRVEGDTDPNLLVIDASADKIGIGDSTPLVKLDVNGGVAWQSSGSATNLTADNQTVTVGDRSFISLSSNDGTAANRTFVLSNGLADGQNLILAWNGTNAGEIVAASNIKLSATWTPTQYDTLRLIWSTLETAWLELGRSANA